MEIFVNNETDLLEKVVLGIGIDKGQPRAINPSIRKHLADNTFPTEETICAEIKTFEDVLTNNGVEVLRPSNLMDVEQIFTRDIGFVIGDRFFISNMKYGERKKEQEGLSNILDSIHASKIVHVPKEIRIEGGDVILWNDHIFIGISDRTSENAIPFIQQIFPEKNVLGFEMVIDQDSVDKNILHLDCAFQPIGKDEAIIYFDGFKNYPAALVDLFSREKLIEVTLDEKNQMFPNIFSISPTKIVIEKNFSRLKSELLKRGYEVLEVSYSETSKLSGLLRCSTLPIKRRS